MGEGKRLWSENQPSEVWVCCFRWLRLRAQLFVETEEIKQKHYRSAWCKTDKCMKNLLLGLISTFMSVILICRYLSHNSHIVASFFWGRFHKNPSKPWVQVQFLNFTCDCTQSPKCLRIALLKAILRCIKHLSGKWELNIRWLLVVLNGVKFQTFSAKAQLMWCGCLWWAAQGPLWRGSPAAT